MERKTEGVMDDESGKSMEPMGVVPQNEGKHTGSN